MQETSARIGADPRFAALQKARSRTVWTLSALVAAAFYGFLSLQAYWPALFAHPILASSPITIGLAYGALLIVFCILLTGVYVRRARVFDAINQEILARASQSLNPPH